jgi:hypothetical protein
MAIFNVVICLLAKLFTLYPEKVIPLLGSNSVILSVGPPLYRQHPRPAMASAWNWAQPTSVTLKDGSLQARHSRLE